MCGIAVIFGYGAAAPAVDRDELLKIRDAMRVRGPDGEGLWIQEDGRLGLAHRRLSIIDLSSAGAQPMEIEGGALRLIFNGEIYNYRALREDLECRGRRFFSQCDSEVILQAYAQGGEDALSALRGMYAFALWDARKKALLLARDPLGIKPLYYADDGQTIRIASQVRALRAGGKISAAIDPAGAAGFHLLGSVPEPFTLWKSIHALPAGHRLWIDTPRGASAPRKFFSLAAEVPSVIPPFSLRDCLLESVRHHLVSDVPVGIFLSSGIDSATLAALACELQAPDRLHTVTLGFEEFQGTSLDEMPLAQTLAQRLGTTHHARVIRRADFDAALPQILQSMDQPSIDGINTYFVSLSAHEAGLKVALSGVGGDELFGGYPSFRAVPRMVSQALSLLNSIPTVGQAFRKYFAGKLSSPKMAGLLEYGGTTVGAYLLRRGIFMPWELEQCLDPEMAREGLAELNLLGRWNSTIAEIPEWFWKISALETSGYLRNQLLRDADWAGMAHSLEIRTPWVDAVLHSQIRALAKKGKPLDKRALSRTPTRPLPEAVWRRPKTGFTTPLYRWTGQEGGTPGLRAWTKKLFQITIAS